MGIISVEQANSLYWLGRYTERVYTTIRIYFKRFDQMIDESKDSYEQFCQMIDIPNVYTSREDFLKRYPFDTENPDSIISNMYRAYDNAIVLREQITSEALSYIQLAVYELKKAAISKSPLLELQQVLDDLLAFWGTIDDRIDSEHIRNIIKAGKRIERVDLYARLGLPAKEILREVHRLQPRVERSGLPYEKEKLEKLEALVLEPEIDYYKIVFLVESIL